MQPFDIDLSLLKKYDRPGPRYTSYPTAPLFSTAFTPGDFRREIIETNPAEATGDLSLYFHFPFCDTLCYFCGCTMLVSRDRGRIEEYNRVLKQEVSLIAPLLGPMRRVVQIHWGGGTPTHLTPDQIRDFGDFTRRSFQIDPSAEMSVEVDPRELTRDHLVALREAGFARMSMGVQDFDEGVQQAVNRIQPEAMTRRVYDWAREVGFTSINIDLMYGLPFQTPESYAATVNTALTLDPDRVAVFNYAHVPWMKPHQKVINIEDLPAPEQKLKILKLTIETLARAGYLYIGMDHFAKPNDELAQAQRDKTLYRNFQGYSTKSGADLYGFGMSSISNFKKVYAQNTKIMPEYLKVVSRGSLATHVGYRMTEDDQIRKFVIMRLMCDLELDKRVVEARFAVDFDEYFADALQALEELVDDGLVSIDDNAIVVTGAGRLVLRNIAMCFDAYLRSMDRTTPLFSRTV
jgi:oxygen-independent coproporphyrinogen-3 oxidase